MFLSISKLDHIIMNIFEEVMKQWVERSFRTSSEMCAHYFVCRNGLTSNSADVDFTFHPVTADYLSFSHVLGSFYSAPTTFSAPVCSLCLYVFCVIKENKDLECNAKWLVVFRLIYIVSSNSVEVDFVFHLCLINESNISCDHFAVQSTVSPPHLSSYVFSIFAHIVGEK